MAKGLEGMYRKSLDADVERKGAKEIDWNKDDIDIEIQIAVEEEEAREKKEQEEKARLAAERQAKIKAEREAWKASFSEMSIDELDSAYGSLTLTEKEEERAKLEAELMSAHGEGEDLKAKIAILDKRLEIARDEERRAREVVMELEGIF